MKRWITYHHSPRSSPITTPVCLSRGGWTSKESAPLSQAETQLIEEALNIPPAKLVPGKGYPFFHVRIDGFEWTFGSLEEIDVVIRTFSQRHLPNVRSLYWWPNRLPSGMTRWTKRQQITRALRQARHALEREIVKGGRP